MGWQRLVCSRNYCVSFQKRPGDLQKRHSNLQFLNRDLAICDFYNKRWSKRQPHLMKLEGSAWNGMRFLVRPPRIVFVLWRRGTSKLLYNRHTPFSKLCDSIFQWKSRDIRKSNWRICIFEKECGVTVDPQAGLTFWDVTSDYPGTHCMYDLRCLYCVWTIYDINTCMR